ncbi:MAG TPA: uracil-DNA glycosylase family protein, partial [Ktedonobacterales bacterium]
TWRNLLDLLARVRLAPERCFFTNAYIGLKLGSSATGAFPGARDPDFVRRCQALLAEEIRVMCPHVIATLGVYVPAFLASLAPTVLTRWSSARSLTALDKEHTSVVPSVVFPGCPEPVTLVALTHPAYRRLNVQYRAYGDLRGDAAELRMLLDALHGTPSPPSG